ncbi:MAG: chromosome segregation protein SMC [Planctomycetes bacterium]|nr:chromosome segregation protein SMC [Planctomycetota bacterium]
MKLKRLTLHGFKSFARKTEIDFERGITFIFGPNGCGKSNVVDSIRWVLGEQSAKSLRGEAMQDVIFAGSAAEKAMEFARVALEFDNSRRALPLEENSVTVERRLFRSGESEYLVNNKPAKLREVRDLFMDTGVGRNAYAIIEQGKVEALLSANSRDRRAIFEEAAGIGRFRLKKRLALLKLERVEQNLTRLSDVHGEVQKRLRSVKAQAGRAKTWQEYATRLKELKTAEGLQEYDTLEKGRRENDRFRADLRANESRLKAEIAGHVERLARLDREVAESETGFEALHREIVALQAEMGAAVESIAADQNQIHNEEEAQEKSRLLLEDLAARRAQHEGERRELDANVKKAAKELAGAEKTLATEGEKLKDLAERARALLARRDDLRRQAAAAAAAESALVEELGRLDGDARAAADRRARIARRTTEIDEETVRLDGELDGLGGSQKEAQALLGDFKSDYDAREQRLAHEIDTVNHLSREIEARLADLTRAESRHAALDEFVRRREGLHAGARALLAAAADGERSLAGVRGVAADFFTIDPEAVAAAERLAGETAGYVVVDTVATLRAALAWLDEHQAGSARFLVLDRIPAAPAPKSKLPAGAKKLGLATLAARVTPKNEAGEAVARHLFGRALLAADRDAALAALDGLDAGWFVLTPAGEMFGADGVAAGGSGDVPQGVLTQKAEMERLAREIEVQRAALATLREEKEKRLAVLKILEDEVKSLRAKIYDGNIAALEIRNRMDGAARRRGYLSEERAQLTAEESELAAALTARQTREQEARAQREEATAKKSGAAHDLDALESDMTRVAADREAQESAASDARVAHSRLSQIVATLSRDLAGAKQSLENADHLIAVTKNEIAASKKKAADLASRIADRKGFVLTGGGRRAALDEQMAGVTTRRQALREQHETLSQTRAALDSEFQLCLESAAKIDAALSEAVARQKALSQRMWEEYEINLADLHIDRGGAGEIDPAATRAEIESLQQKIRRLGAVNVEAIEELRGLEERDAFFQTQKNDLVRARDQLLHVIRRIDEKCARLFRDTFDRVGENFKATFRRLFGGGKAEIVLENEADILESGIDIIARPPGKDPQSISLLSGGEKSLTAVALLLAFFKARPTPFCILDEVDAALDESNVGRYRDLVQEFSADHQFLVITHSKVTMLAADVMYGITQEVSGVSKKVAVRFEDVRREEPAAVGS